MIVVVVRPCCAAYLLFARVAPTVFRTLLPDHVVPGDSALRAAYLLLYVIGDWVSKSALGEAFFGYPVRPPLSCIRVADVRGP
jgi:hypothetical protein